ncbi:hypothetical protein LFYK43_12080 [Ligilactobacillus salitolerans]|uniref:AttH domain-containing protein n=1 Tax=Ligilactobacillus salitolerans TaxID=1808352 RepID=A0A401ITA4_9LACO|nr:lipocalin-like domain-containing protein [Ligilactobacillus salitolerans]GBG94749.1 hypothetical protein LFYK43_12080 [Ligilactobacillus salitolerans]
MAQRARLGDTDADFEKYHTKKNEVEQWEDGMRIDPAGENYEWWYFDANLADGSQLVITFYAKSAVDPSSGLKPMIDVDLTRPDGTVISDKLSFAPEEFSASKEKCDVKVGDNYFRGDLNHYEIGVNSPKIKVQLSSDNVTPAWRRTVAIFFGNDDEGNFGWLPSTPRGEVAVKIEVNGQKEELKGDCYHDHNWGNVALLKVMHHWYWGRANLGDYTVIDSYMTAEKKYGYQKLPVFLLAKKGEILADDPQYLTYSEKDKDYDGHTQKPFHNEVVYDYNDGQNHYRISYLREKTITKDRMIEQIEGPKKFAAKFMGFDGAYLRFSGKVRLEIFAGDEVVEKHESQGLWEEMYFGKTLDV